MCAYFYLRINTVVAYTYVFIPMRAYLARRTYVRAFQIAFYCKNMNTLARSRHFFFGLKYERMCAEPSTQKKPHQFGGA